MEKTNNSNSIEPLPGVRQGMSGVDAGHDSERDIDPVVLMRRTHRTQEVTAQTTDGEGQPNTSTGRPTVLIANREASRRNDPAKRIKWDKEMNKSVIRTYLLINECREDPLPGWRQ